MICPKCKCELKAWPWQDGGYKGVECTGCDTKWWSDDFADKAYEAEKKAIQEVLKTESFPSDAEEDVDRKNRSEEEIKNEY